MLGNAFNLGKLSGIQFRIHYSWFIIFILVTYSLSGEFFPDAYPAWPLFLYWTIGTISSLLFFASVVAHELAHSLVARANGMPVKSITLFIFGGVAQLTREAAKARAELLMAAAGPACSLAVGGFFGLLWFLTQYFVEPVAAIFIWLAQINVVLAVFNLIPGFPLDGGRIFHSLLWRFTRNYGRSLRIATLVGQGTGNLFILGGIVIAFLLRDWFGGLWLALIGWFLVYAASTSYHQARWRERLATFTAARVMTSNYRIVPSSITVDELLRGQLFFQEHLTFLVADDGRLEGMITLHNIRALPREQRAVSRLKEIMVPVLLAAHPEQDVLSIVEQMDESDTNQVPVVSEGRVVGIIARDNLVKLR